LQSPGGVAREKPACLGAIDGQPDQIPVVQRRDPVAHAVTAGHAGLTIVGNGKAARPQGGDQRRRQGVARLSGRRRIKHDDAGGSRQPCRQEIRQAGREHLRIARRVDPFDVGAVGTDGAGADHRPSAPAA